jgi:hypothetical protein
LDSTSPIHCSIDEEFSPMAKAISDKKSKTPASGTKATRTGAKSAPKTRNRRAPALLLADLQAQRDQIAERLGARLAKLDARIARVEARYDTQIRLAELTTGTSLDDLQQRFEEAKRQQKLIRMALKAKA